jgi:hypothetical protein
MSTQIQYSEFSDVKVALKAAIEAAEKRIDLKIGRDAEDILIGIVNDLGDFLKQLTCYEADGETGGF